MTDTIDPAVNPGWRFDLESQARKAMSLPVRRIPKAFRDFAKPSEIDPRKWHRIESQGAIGACQGNCLASCLERLYWVATGGEVTQFSRIFAYLATQKRDGLLGSDRGSTIAGGVEVAAQHGLPFEEQVPYPNPARYPSRSDINRILSAKNYEAGQPYKIRSQVAIRSYEDCIDWLAGGGAVSIGIAWPVQLDRNATVNSFGGGGRGGHAIAILGYLRNGNLVVANSHSERYGDSGWFYVTPSAFGQMLRHRYTACYGLSDMGQPKPRRVDFRKSKMFG